MEFTDPHVAEQLLAEMEEKEQQLALAAEFGTTLLARTEELQSGMRRLPTRLFACNDVPCCCSYLPHGWLAGWLSRCMPFRWSVALFSRRRPFVLMCPAACAVRYRAR